MYGSPDVLQLREVARPLPRAQEILVRVRAGVVSPADCAFRKGEPLLIKLIYGLTRPRLSTLGVEFAGEVEDVGPGVTRFKPGDQVFGMSPDRFGAHAEYLCLREDKPVITKPADTTYEEAAAILDGAPTALTFLRDVARLQRGQTVLINGASGAVGSAAVQLARAFGAKVTGVCSGANVALVRSLGADAVIDYTKEDFTRSGRTYDVIFDTVGKSTFARCRGALTPRGIYLSTVPTLDIALQMLWTIMSSGRRARFATAGLMQNNANLAFLKDLVERGQLKALIDRRYPLEGIAEAHRYVETGHKRGNVIITVG
jgi:NADPH:quinone reductase-like Zn-dependent oxidoreductase